MKYYTETTEEALEMLQELYEIAKKQILSGASMSASNHDYPGDKREIRIELDYSEIPKRGYHNEA